MYSVETHKHQVVHRNGRSRHLKYQVKDAGWRVSYGKLAGNARQTRVRLCADPSPGPLHRQWRQGRARDFPSAGVLYREWLLQVCCFLKLTGLKSSFCQRNMFWGGKLCSPLPIKTLLPPHPLQGGWFTCNGSGNNSNRWGFPHSNNFLTAAQRPTIQLNSNAIYLESVSSHRLKAPSHKAAPTSGTNPKSRLSVTCISDRQATDQRFPRPPTRPLTFFPLPGETLN